jgi:hypothetical protein
MIMAVEQEKFANGRDLRTRQKVRENTPRHEAAATLDLLRHKGKERENDQDSHFPSVWAKRSVGFR